jgi:polyisoprenoid-binding protein YceI
MTPTIIEKCKNACALAILGIALVAVRPAHAQNSGSGPTKAGGVEYTLNHDRSTFQFSIGHFVVSSTQGRFLSVDGKLQFDPNAPDHGIVSIHVSPSSISTDNAARDEHLRSADFFDVARYPSTMFDSTTLSMLSDRVGKVTGTLLLHGISKPITIDVTYLTLDPNADRQHFSAIAKLKRSAFGMTNYLSVIGDEVTLNIDVEFDRAH